MTPDRPMGIEATQAPLPVTPELLPCPFCGGEAKFKSDFTDGRDVGRVYCTGCGASEYPFVRPKAETFAAWNTRSQSHSLPGDVGMREALNGMTHLAADERDRTILLSKLLEQAREYVSDAMDAHNHDDGRKLLDEIDAALSPQSDEGEECRG